MTNRDHKKLLATFLFISGVLQMFSWIVIGGWLGGKWLLLVSALFYMLTGWKIHNQQSGAKTFAIVASILCLPSIPIGTVLGIYGLWVFLQASEDNI